MRAPLDMQQNYSANLALQPRYCAMPSTANAERAGVSEQVEIRAGMAEELPVDDSSIDVIISNGVINLAPDKNVAFAEIARVLKPGGRLYLADVILSEELSQTSRSDAELWAA